MPLSLGSAIAMILVFITLLLWTIMTRARLKPDATLNRLHPIVAARTAALAMAASRVGSLAFGFYLGVLIANIAADYSSAGTDRIRISAVTAIASLLTAVVALWLERICRVKEPPSNNENRSSK
jgi:ABC-type enterochelin transport system permease subunit